MLLNVSMVEWAKRLLTVCGVVRIIMQSFSAKYNEETPEGGANRLSIPAKMFKKL